ncbi:MAG: hypothetical protein HETSPECPRED_009421 [Heterodermia speciosa]|uniref:Uncharacterized protein n=1 Tax=Heterodermia speciosa TaxID=116794 RepID=A0A8H3IW30_9LECA|nr:MAG: hypothetical protein HETSPECPRED_009421 [Heterodermia speciosa]
MQEIALGAGMTSVLCGHEAVTLEQLFAAIFTFDEHNIDIVFPLIDKERKEIGLPPLGLQRNRIIHLNEEQAVQSGTIDGQFICILDLSRKSLATDPKDKVYGLLGLMDPSLAGLIEPDYEAPLSKVYTGFAKAIIVAGEGESLGIFEQCTWPRNDIPSWVPDWTNKNHYRLFSGRSTYKAFMSMKPQIKILDHDRRLSTLGYSLGRIDSLGISYYEDSIEAKVETDCMVQTKGSNNVYGTTERLREALWRTFVGNRTPNGRLVPDSYSLLLECVSGSGGPKTQPRDNL